MARINNLTNFLTDVAAAIKTKKGDSTSIAAEDFDTEILALPGGQGNYEQKTVPISQNGEITITPDTGYDAMDEVTVQVAVPEKQLQTKNYTFNQNTITTLSPETGYDGFSSVGLNINVPVSGTASYNSIAAMEASSPSDGDWAYVYNTSMEGLFQYQELTDMVPIPYKTAVAFAASASTYTPSNQDVYVNATKLVTIVNQMITDNNMKKGNLFGSAAVSELTVTIINNKPYVVLGRGTKNNSDAPLYGIACNGITNATPGTTVSNLYVSMQYMNYNVKLTLWELDFDNTTYKQPVIIDFNNLAAANNVFYYIFGKPQDTLICNHCCILVNKNGTIKLPANYYTANLDDPEDPGRPTSPTPSTGTVTFTPAAHNSWVLQDNSTYLDTSDATATTSDIDTGKIAYVNGQKLTGTGVIFDQLNDVKRYDNETDLNAATESIGTKGMIYGEEQIYPIGEDEIITNLYAPATIVLDTPVTAVHSYIIKYKQAALRGSYGDRDTTQEIDPYQAVIGLRVSASGAVTISARVIYTSSDGITYTRDQVQTDGATWDAETEVLSWPKEGILKTLIQIKDIQFADIDDVCAKFLKTTYPTLGGIYEFKYDGTQNKYVNLDTQLTVSSNSEVFPGKIALGVNGETFVGDDTIFDHFSPKTTFTKIYNQPIKKRYSQPIADDYLADGYDFYHIASVPNIHKLYYPKTATDLAILNDGCIGEITNHFTPLKLDHGITVYSPYTNISSTQIYYNKKYNYIITLQYNTNDTNKVGAIVVYDYNTKAVVSHSTEFNYANNTYLYEVSEDFIALDTISTSENSIQVFDLRNFSMKSVWNLSDTYIGSSIHVIEDYMVYDYYTKTNESNHDYYVYVYDPYTDSSATSLTSQTDVNGNINFALSSDTNYLYIYMTVINKLVKYDKTNKTVIYTVDAFDSGTKYRFNTYANQSDNLSYIFVDCYAIDKATGLQQNKVGINLLDKNNEIIATTVTTECDSAVPLYEKNNKYYALVNGILGIGTIQSATDSGGIKTINLSCEKIHHVPYIVYKGDVPPSVYMNDILFYGFEKYISPSQFELNQDDSITYIIDTNNIDLEFTVQEYRNVAPSECENVIIPTSSYSSDDGYPSANMVLQPIRDVSL